MVPPAPEGLVVGVGGDHDGVAAARSGWPSRSRGRRANPNGPASAATRHLGSSRHGPDRSPPGAVRDLRGQSHGLAAAAAALPPLAASRTRSRPRCSAGGAGRWSTTCAAWPHPGAGAGRRALAGRDRGRRRRRARAGRRRSAGRAQPGRGRAAGRSRPDAVYLNGVPAFVACPTSAWRACPCSVTSTSWSRLRRSLAPADAAARSADRYVAVSQAVADNLVAARHRAGPGGGPPRLRGRRCAVTETAMASLRAELGLRPPRRSAMVGGPGLAQRARPVRGLAAALADRVPGAHLVGRRVTRAGAWERPRSTWPPAASATRCTWWASAGTLTTVLAAADVLALTSREDPFPLAALGRHGPGCRWSPSTRVASPSSCSAGEPAAGWSCRRSTSPRWPRPPATPGRRRPAPAWGGRGIRVTRHHTTGRRSGLLAEIEALW